MQTISIVLLFIFLAPISATAAQIFGTLKEADQPLPAGVKVETICDGTPYHGETDSYGAYSVFVDAKGKCVFTVRYKGQAVTHDIFSYDNPIRYDFTLVQQNGQYVLKRQ